MTISKYIITLLLLATAYNAESESQLTLNQWIDIESIKVRHDKSIQYITRIGKVIPTVTLIEIKDGQLAINLSLNTPEYFKRDKEWINDFRVIYQNKDQSRVLGKLDGESFNIPNGQWVSSLTFLPSSLLLKKNVANIIIQAKATKARLVHINQKKADKLARENMTDKMMDKVPFPINTIGELFDFKLNLYDGSVFNSKQHRGKVILLDFWSWNCGPCRKAIPELKELSAKYKDDKLVIIGINFDDYENIDEIIKQQTIFWPQWVVTEDYMDLAIYKKLKFNGIPYYIIIDQTGVLVKQGYTNDMDLNKDISKLIE